MAVLGVVTCRLLALYVTAVCQEREQVPCSYSWTYIMNTCNSRVLINFCN